MACHHVSNPLLNRGAWKAVGKWVHSMPSCQQSVVKQGCLEIVLHPLGRPFDLLLFSVVEEVYDTRRQMCRVGQNRIYTPYMTVYLVISLPKLPYIHRIYMVLANPANVAPFP